MINPGAINTGIFRIIYMRDFFNIFSDDDVDNALNPPSNDTKKMMMLIITLKKLVTG